MAIQEIRARELNASKFIEEQIRKISATVKDGSAINALSGGVDSSVVTLLGHKALGKKLTTVFIDNGLMRQDEPRAVISLFEKLGVPVKLIYAQDEFLILECLKRYFRSGEKERGDHADFLQGCFWQAC